MSREEEILVEGENRSKQKGLSNSRKAVAGITRDYLSHSTEASIRMELCFSRMLWRNAVKQLQLVFSYNKSIAYKAASGAALSQALTHTHL